MDRAALTAIVLEVVHDQAQNPQAVVAEDTPLGLEGLGIDSIGCLDILLELERRTGITLRDETLTAESLATPRSVVDYLLATASRD